MTDVDTDPGPTAPTSRRGLTKVLGRSAAWGTLDVTLSRFAQLAQGIIVARILAPEAFGVFAVALVVHAIIVNVSELGASVSLIRDAPERAERSAPTVMTIAVGNATVLGVLMAAGATGLATLLGEPTAAGAIAVMAISLPLAGLTAVPSALLRRNFRNDRMFVANLSNTLLSGVLVVVLALAGWGPMALAWSFVAGQALTTALLLTYRPGRVRPGWDRVEARRLLAFGLPLAGASLLAFSVLNVDYIVIGRRLGAVELGLYALAFNISGWPMNVFGAVVRSVSLPGFAHLRNAGELAAGHFASALRLVASVTIPICLLLGALAEPVITLVYGSQWSAAAGALVGLSVLGAARIVIELCGDYLVSLGRTRAVFLTQVPWLLGLLAGLVIVVPRAGIGGAGAVQAGVALAVVLLYTVMLARAGVAPRLVLSALGPPAAWAVVAAVIAHTVAGRFDRPLVAVLAGGGVAAVVYLAPFLPSIRRGVTAWRAGAGEDEVPVPAQAA
jgi:O-antigen/teichoic acid export membrane protein